MLTRRSFARLVLPAILCAPTLSTSAHPVFDSGRIIQYQRQECLGAAGHQCGTVHSRFTRVGAGEVREVTLTCPSVYPHAVGWDAKRHEHLELTVAPQPAAAVPSASGELRSLTVLVRNHGNMAGSFRLYVGCSTRPFAGTGGFMSQAHASPSRLIQEIRR
ncbi:hypothetical protein [Geminicoccus flavidas]|uniref:hypothetical protein n=1 Tax=Geminicoccus flavidas TaxID=2506407 RepID=UPI0013579144|nr:hypothetical protein [Geminicoccus flavidas]